MQRRLRLRAGGDGQLGVLRQPDPGVGARTRRLAALRRAQGADSRRAAVQVSARRRASWPACPTSAPTKARAAPARPRWPVCAWPRNTAWRRPGQFRRVSHDHTFDPGDSAGTGTTPSRGPWRRIERRTYGYQALKKALSMEPDAVIGAVKDSGSARPRRRGLLHRDEMVVHPAGRHRSRRQAALPGGQRRRVGTRYVQRHSADVGDPARARRGRHHRLLRDPGQPRLHLRAR